MGSGRDQWKFLTPKPTAALTHLAFEQFDFTTPINPSDGPAAREKSAVIALAF